MRTTRYADGGETQKKIDTLKQTIAQLEDKKNKADS